MRNMIILLGLTAVIVSSGCSTTINVSSTEELVNAIGSNRTIHLAPGDYILSEVQDRHMDHIRWDPEYDGKTLTIRNVNNMKMIGSENGTVRLLVRPKYVYVLNFENCENTYLENLVLGHSPDSGYCTSGVLGATDSSHLILLNCDLFGCGTEGLTLKNVRDMKFHKSTVRDCTYGIMTMTECKNIRFTQSSFMRNKEYWGVNIQDTENVLFSACNFENNQAEGEALFSVVSSSNIQIQNCVFNNNNIKPFPKNSSETIDRKNNKVQELIEQQNTLDKK